MKSNQLADTSFVDMSWLVKCNFKKALTQMKDDLAKNGCIFPTLEANMRNQINISSINIEGAHVYAQNVPMMQSSINKLKSGTSLVGEIPILVKLKEYDWRTKKGVILKHHIDEMNKNDKKNVVVFFSIRISFSKVLEMK